MKKIQFISILFVALLLSFILISCGNKSICEHEYGDPCLDTTCSKCGEERKAPGHELVTPDIEGCQVPSYCTCCDYQTCEEILSHNYIDENGNRQDVCTVCGEPNGGTSSDEDMFSLQFTYDYGFHIENIAVLLADGGYLGKGFESIERPNDIVAGDIIKLVHTGEIWTEEIYPSRHCLSNDGHLISYSFEYAHVIHLTGDEFSVDRVKNNYDYKYDYVIIDRTGKYVSLDDYAGTEIYLVTDQQRYANIYGETTEEGVPDVNYPIASMFAYNPRDLEDGVPVKTVPELRNEKVSFDLDYHEIGNELQQKEENKADKTKHDFGYIGTNENGNEYIIYAPNVYSYYVAIKCTEDLNGVESVIRKIEYDYFDRFHTGSYDEIHIDAVELFDNEILITFPDFDSYALCQEELLNKLSELDSVLKIEVSYLNIQDGSDVVEDPYEYINLGYYYKLKEENRLFRTYDELCEAFTDGLPAAERLDVITEETFESYYVFMIISTYSGDTYGFDISDARIDGNRVFFTTNKYVKSGLHDTWLATDYCIVLVPKQELGELPNDISSVIDMQIGVYVDRYESAQIDMGDAISIAFSHFYANYNFTPVANHTYIAEAIDGAYFDDYWYIWIHPIYIGNEGDGLLWDGECITYTIDKTNGGIINIEVDE